MNDKQLDLAEEFGIDFYLDPDLKEKITELILLRKERAISAEDFRYEMQDCIHIARIKNKILPIHSNFLEYLFVYTDNV